MTFEQYAAEETPGLAAGEKLLSPEQVMERLAITRRQLQQLHRGAHPNGLFLPAYRLSHKVIRYRPRDLLRLEWQILQDTPVE